MGLVAVTGLVMLGNGQPAAGGDLVIELSETAIWDDGSSPKEKTGGRFITPIAADGSVSFNLKPQDELYVDGQASSTFWRFDYTMRDAQGAIHFKSEHITLTSSPSSQNLSDLTVVSAVNNIGRLARDTIVTALPTASDKLRGVRVILIADSTEDIVYQCLGDAQATPAYDWAVLAVG